MSRLLSLLLVTLLLVPPLPGAQEPMDPVVLVTAFEAFAGRPVNGSATIARHLDQSRIGEARIQNVLLILRVRWGEVEARLPALLERHRPILILGLGEGLPGRIACESVAHNTASGACRRILPIIRGILAHALGCEDPPRSDR